jgi:hypothetical protein
MSPFLVTKWQSAICRHCEQINPQIFGKIGDLDAASLDKFWSLVLTHRFKDDGCSH